MMDAGTKFSSLSFPVFRYQCSALEQYKCVAVETERKLLARKEQQLKYLQDYILVHSHVDKQLCSEQCRPSSHGYTTTDLGMESKLVLVQALARGYLIRRLLNSHKVRSVILTIKDAQGLLYTMQEEPQAQDLLLKQRLHSQLSGARKSLHHIFFKMSISGQMAYIAASRQDKKKLTSTIGQSTKLSAATVKSRKRRLEQRHNI